MVLLNGEITVKVISDSGAIKNFAELCSDCPRKTGKETQVERAPGIRGLFGKTITNAISMNDRPLSSGVLNNYETDGYDGVFYGPNSGENSGTVVGLSESSAERFVTAVVTCNGPEEDGNVCAALGRRSTQAIFRLADSMETAIDDTLGGKTSLKEGAPVNLVIDNQVPLAIE